MVKTVSRRELLKLGSLTLSALALRPLEWMFDGEQALDLKQPVWPAMPDPPDEKLAKKGLKARVATRAVYLYREPDFRSERIGTLKRDRILRIEEPVWSPKGPPRNPRWYRLATGFVHSAHLQRVEETHLNLPLRWIPESGWLGEITVPYAQSMRSTRTYGWVPVYRLYFRSVHWITGVEAGPDGNLWYRLTDELLHVNYYVPAAYVRIIQPEELSPISPDVPAQEKRIEISIKDQTLTAYEGDQVVLRTRISSGIPSRGPSPNGIPTDTPKGYFHVEVKVPSKHMGDGKLTSDIEAYELPGVPWVSFFHIEGIALHGTYWHDNFGSMMSHGCVNMRNEDAKWIYRWTHPVANPEDWNRKGHGTLIRIV